MKKNKKSYVVYGYPSVGKTSTCKNFSNFIDLESSDYHWIFSDEQLGYSVEERKGIEKKENPNWPHNYFEAINENLKKYDYVFVAYQGIIYAQSANLDYIRIYPDLSCKQEYLDRMEKRGNPPEFISKMSENWENYLTESELDDNKNCVQKIVLKSGEYLCDIIATLKI